MPDTQQKNLPVWFWIIGALALLWNLAGVGAYFSEVGKSAEDLAKMATEERALYENTPAWAVGAFAIAVFGGAIGCILLLLRNKTAAPVFGASLAGILVQMAHSFFIANSMAVYGPGAAIMPAMVIAIGALLVWFSIQSKNKGWLK